MDEIKFKDIKVDDLVLNQRKITYGWRNELTFWLHEKVTRVTKAQFEVAGEIFWKKDGSKVGGQYFDGVKPLGSHTWNHKVIEDQTKEYLSAKAKLKAFKEFREKVVLLEKMSVPTLIEKDLSQIENLNKSISTLIGES